LYFILLSLQTTKKPDKRTLYELLGKLGQSYERFYQSAMRFYLRVQLNTILQKTRPKKLQSILNSTVELCLQDEEIIRIIIQVGQFRSFLEIFFQNESKKLGKRNFNTFSNIM
jgi:hypothetical protein